MLFLKQDTGRGEREIVDCAGDGNDVSVLSFDPVSSLCQPLYAIIQRMQKFPHSELKGFGWVCLGPR